MLVRCADWSLPFIAMAVTRLLVIVCSLGAFRLGIQGLWVDEDLFFKTVTLE